MQFMLNNNTYNSFYLCDVDLLMNIQCDNNKKIQNCLKNCWWADAECWWCHKTLLKFKEKLVKLYIYSHHYSYRIAELVQFCTTQIFFILFNVANLLELINNDLAAVKTAKLKKIDNESMKW